MVIHGRPPPASGPAARTGSNSAPPRPSRCRIGTTARSPSSRTCRPGRIPEAASRRAPNASRAFWLASALARVRCLHHRRRLLRGHHAADDRNPGKSGDRRRARPLPPSPAPPSALCGPHVGSRVTGWVTVSFACRCSRAGGRRLPSSSPSQRTGRPRPPDAHRDPAHTEVSAALALAASLAASLGLAAPRLSSRRCRWLVAVGRPVSLPAWRSGRSAPPPGCPGCGCGPVGVRAAPVRWSRTSGPAAASWSSLLAEPMPSLVFIPPTAAGPVSGCRPWPSPARRPTSSPSRRRPHPSRHRRPSPGPSRPHR